MKRLFRLLAVAALAVPAAVAMACDGDSGFGCENMCPLAKQANVHRSFGTESPVAKAAVDAIQKNLARV